MALPCPETPRRPSIPRLWWGRCSTNRPQAAFPAPSSPRPASISKTPAAARPPPRPAPCLRLRAEWQSKGRRPCRCPLGFSLFAIPKRERKSRQRHRRCLPCFIFIARCLPPALSPARTILQPHPRKIYKDHLNTDFHTHNEYPSYFLLHRILT